MMARSTTRSNLRPDTLMQDRRRQFDEILLQRTAGPYNRVKTGSGHARTACPFYPQEQTPSGRPGRSEKWQKRSFWLRSSSRTVAARQSDDELGKCAGLGLDIDPSAMLLDDDVMGHREAEPCPFPARVNLN